MHILWNFIVRSSCGRDRRGHHEVLLSFFFADFLGVLCVGGCWRERAVYYSSSAHPEGRLTTVSSAFKAFVMIHESFPFCRFSLFAFLG